MGYNPSISIPILSNFKVILTFFLGYPSWFIRRVEFSNHKNLQVIAGKVEMDAVPAVTVRAFDMVVRVVQQSVTISFRYLK